MLDEPFAGIDPIAIEEVKDTILKLKNSGIGIIVTDHNVREALKIVDYANVYNGEIVKEGTPKVIIKDEFVKKSTLAKIMISNKKIFKGSYFPPKINQ